VTGGSVENLQRKLSSMLTENQSYREMSRDKDQKLERDQNKMVVLEEELEKLKEENRHLLVSKLFYACLMYSLILLQKMQQSADLERKEWERVSEHAQSVLDENVSLIKQQELLREQIKEMKAQHQAIGETKKKKKILRLPFTSYSQNFWLVVFLLYYLRFIACLQLLVL
jgi:hypothetical protein